MSKAENTGEISTRTAAAYKSVREQLQRTGERADKTLERLKEKLERSIEHDHEPEMKASR